MRLLLLGELLLRRRQRDGLGLGLVLRASHRGGQISLRLGLPRLHHAPLVVPELVRGHRLRPPRGERAPGLRAPRRVPGFVHGFDVVRQRVSRAELFVAPGVLARERALVGVRSDVRDEELALEELLPASLVRARELGGLAAVRLAHVLREILRPGEGFVAAVVETPELRARRRRRRRRVRGGGHHAGGVARGSADERLFALHLAPRLRRGQAGRSPAEGERAGGGAVEGGGVVVVEGAAAQRPARVPGGTPGAVRRGRVRDAGVGQAPESARVEAVHRRRDEQVGNLRGGVPARGGVGRRAPAGIRRPVLHRREIGRERARSAARAPRAGGGPGALEEQERGARWANLRRPPADRRARTRPPRVARARCEAGQSKHRGGVESPKSSHPVWAFSLNGGGRKDPETRPEPRGKRIVVQRRASFTDLSAARYLSGKIISPS